MSEIAVFFATAVASGLLTRWIRLWALSTGTLDVPNARSSHVVATPRGGGLAIALLCVATVGISSALGLLEWKIGLTLCVGGGAIALVGHIDDRRGLPAVPRLCVHVVVATVAVLMLTQWGDSPVIIPHIPRAVGAIALVVGLTWYINLFNFMDGIDGLAASQALCIFLSSLAFVLVSSHAAEPWAFVLAGSSGACAGFLVWNWPPARIFMGDVGSGFLGFWVGATAVAMHLSGDLSIWTSIILASLFIADASVTVLRRICRRERWYEAHRSHAYQRLARRWKSHLNVTVLLWTINLAVIIPCAAASVIRPELAAVLATGVLLTVAAICLSLGAGLPD